MPARVDRLAIERISSTGGGHALDNFTSFHAVMDITQPFETNLEVGDDATWETLQAAIAHGTTYGVRLNGKPLMRGRVITQDLPFDVPGGATVRFGIRTKLGDAMFDSAEPSIEVNKSTTLLDFILALYEPLGIGRSDFIGLQQTARTIASGKLVRGNEEVRFARMKIDEARVQPPETIYAAADRHLRRFGLMHWDSPDGKIVIGAPDNAQAASYHFRSFRRTSSALARDANNVIGATRVRDWSNVPSTVQVLGFGTKRDFSRVGLFGQDIDLDLAQAGFHRPVYIHAEGIRNQDAADAAAKREMSDRRKDKDSIPIEVDGFSQFDGSRWVNYCPDTLADLRSDVHGGQLGPYYVHRVEFTRDAMQGDFTRLATLRAGLWDLTPAVFEGKLLGKTATQRQTTGATPQINANLETLFPGGGFTP